MSLDYAESPAARGGDPGDEWYDPPQLGVTEEEEEPYEYEKEFWLKFPYFSKEFASEVTERYGKHIEEWQGSPYANCVFAAYRAYHNMAVGESEPTTAIEEAGETGELLAMKIASFRGMLKHQIAMVTADRPAWEAQARTADVDAARQVPMTSNLLDYTLTSGLIKKLSDQFEMSKPAASSFLVLGWDANAGRKGDDGNPRGWYTSRVVAPWEMAHEKVRDYEDTSWWICRGFENKWDWVARKAKSDPDLARQIAALDQSGEEFANCFLDTNGEKMVGTEGDRIAVLYVYAKPSIACPDGRFAIVTSDGIVLEDVALPYEDVPITRMCSAEFVGTAVPFADAWMLLAPAEAISAIVSMMMTRVDTCGVPNFTYTTGTEFQISDLSGNNALEYPAGMEKPDKLDLLAIPAEMPALVAMFEKQLEQLSGINSVTRGQPAENITSGAMAALMQSMAIQYNSTDDRAWNLNLERVGTLLVRIFQTHASKPVLISICGSDHAWTISEFQGKDLGAIERVSVKVASAISKMPAGRWQMAETMVQNKMVTSPAEYMRVVQTGQFESEFRGPVSYLNLVKAENEKMMRGEECPVMTWDHDEIHIRDHVAELNGDVRYDMQKVLIFNKHLSDHMENWSKKSREAPDILAALGQPPLPQAAQIGDQGRQMVEQSKGAPPSPPPQHGPPPAQLKQQNTEPTKAMPGPKPAPPGHEPSQVAPKEPMPAKTPQGETVA